MIKKILLLVLTAILVFSLGGCKTGFTMNVSELMRPPKASGENAEIQELIDEQAGGAYTLKYPQNGEYRTAVTTVDFDGDEKEEAIAFYLPSGEAQTIHILIMKEVEGKWTVIGDHASGSTMVDRLLFADLDGDKQKEIVVGYGSYNNLINSLSLYLVESNKSTEIPTTYSYSDIVAANFRNMSRDEIMLLSLYTPERPATASLVTINDTKNSAYTIAETPMDDNITTLTQILPGNVYEGQYGLVIDGMTADGASYSTQILYYNSDYESLERVYFTEDKPTDQKLRSYAFMSQDIDSDSIIEIPNTFKLNIGDNMVDMVAAPIVYWCEYTPQGVLEVNEKTLASLVYGFYFYVPDKWDNSFTAYANYSTNEVTICEWDKKKGIGQELLILKMFTSEVWNDGTSSKGYTELATTDTYVYGFKIPQNNSPLLLTNEEIIDAFTLMKK